MQKSTFGLEKNIAMLLCYVAWFITGIIFFVSEKEDKEVRFHAFQSILCSVVMVVVNVVAGIFIGVLNALPFIGGILSGIFGALIFGVLGLLWFLLWIMMMLSAYQGKKIKLPVIGDIAEKQA